MKQTIKQTAFLHRVLTGQLRMLPDFIIIGVQKCGTTSLYNYLTAHPGIAPAYRKEVSFFDYNFEKGAIWYRAHFPSLLSKVRGQNLITGEATPCYIFHPLAPKRISKMIPTVKLILLLRNPVDRAYSHYQHSLRLGVENLSFEEALTEAKKLRGETEKIVQHEDFHSLYNSRAAYLSRGIYMDQLEAWTSLFPREQMLILKSEDFYTDPQPIVSRVFEFLELPDWKPEKYRRYNYGGTAKMDASMRSHLIDYFKPYNHRLYEYLGVDFGWDE